MFDVDIAGLRRKFGHRPKSFLIFELYQNAVDAGATRITLELYPLAKQLPRVQGRFILRCEDNGEGFQNLAHAYTLFADSSKLDDPEKRGIWNIGEKFVLAFCRHARLETTSGTIEFKNGTRQVFPRKKLPRGTRFEGEIQLTREEYLRCMKVDLFPPKDINVRFGNARIHYREPLKSFEVSLPTTLGDAEGQIRRTVRTTTVHVHEVGPEDHEAYLYEMGIPVVPTGDKWHYDVQQRVLLNMERNNVTPGYLKQLRVQVFNHMANHLGEGDDTAEWVREATGHADVWHKPLDQVLKLRFGTKRVSYDPSDPEANPRAVAAGYTVVHGGSLSAEEWRNVKRENLIPPAGQVTPSPKPYSNDPKAPEAVEIPEAEWTQPMRVLAQYANWVHFRFFTRGVEVRFMKSFQGQACYVKWKAKQAAELHFSLKGLGKILGLEDRQRVHALLIHEFAHAVESNHLSDKYHAACCQLGAQLVEIALVDPIALDSFFDFR